MKLKITIRSNKSLRGQGAFTLVDLVVTVVVIGLIGVMIIPAFGRSSAVGAAAQCLNNLRQLGVSWAMYSDDTQGDLIECHPWTMVNGSRVANTANPYSWAAGYAGNMLSHQAYTPSTEYYSTNRIGFTRSVFYKYYNNIDLLKCPEDNRTAGISSNPVLRSYSMNNWMNGGTFVPNYRFFTKQSDITRPASTFVMIDEDAITIDDSYFVSFMDNRGFISIPTRRHNFGYTMNFADGSASIYKFRDPFLMQYNGPAPSGSGLAGSGNTVDYAFLTNLTTYPSNVWEN